ncbi:MAG: ribosome maturation factor RimP [Syntrophomonas sp.]
MSGAKVIAKIESLITEKLEEIGVELVDLQYTKDHGDQFIRIFIDTENGVDLQLCARVTRMVREIIDSQDDIFYDHIEVSSPGIDRIIKREKDYNRFIGHRIKIKTKELINNQKNFVGVLKAVTNDNVSIEIEGQDILISRDIITVVRLFPDI